METTITGLYRVWFLGFRVWGWVYIGIMENGSYCIIIGYIYTGVK